MNAPSRPDGQIISNGKTDADTSSMSLATSLGAPGFKSADDHEDHRRFVVNADERLVIANRPHSLAAEEIRSLRNVLALRWFKHPLGEKSLSIISPDREEGRSTMAANLAVAFAQAGMRTVLVDADMRYPSQHEIFGVGQSGGLAEVLSGKIEYAEGRMVPGLENLSILTCGAILDSPQRVLLNDRLQKMVDGMKNHFEVILFDTPAASVAGDYQIICARTVGALVVSRRAQSRVANLRKLVRECQQSGIRVLGSTMVGA